MIQPLEMKLNLPVDLSNGETSTTTEVWKILTASRDGDLETVKALTGKHPALAYAQYNYAPPIHFAVREGHQNLVNYLLQLGAHDPSYRTYPFLDSLTTIAGDRGFKEIASLLTDYTGNPSRCRFRGDNGAIHYNRTPVELEFEHAVDSQDIARTAALLKDHPGLVNDQTFFWGEGILSMPAKDNNREMLALLMRYGTKVPTLLKWTQFYYFKHHDTAVFLMENGMDPNVMSWHHVTLLHDMAQKGDMARAALLIEHGADINAIDEEYCTTPLGMAARWRHKEMVALLLKAGADPRKAGAAWAAPLAWAQRKGHSEIARMLESA
jgi:uncharacterized protein